MSTFKHNKGKLVEQPEPCPVNCSPSDMVKGGKCDINGYLNWRPRTYIAEGNFLEDELVEEKDLEFVKQCFWYYPDVHKWTWCDCEEIDYSHRRDNARRIIARRKVTKEEGEKLDIKQLKDEIIDKVRRELVARDNEIERLNGLIKKAHEFGYIDATEPALTLNDSWYNFASENNLT